LGPDTTDLVGDYTPEIYTELRTTAYVVKDLVDIHRFVSTVDPGHERAVWEELNRTIFWLSRQDPTTPPKPAMYFSGMLMEVWAYVYVHVLSIPESTLRAKIAPTMEALRSKAEVKRDRTAELEAWLDKNLIIAYWRVSYKMILSFAALFSAIVLIWGTLAGGRSKFPATPGWVVFGRYSIVRQTFLEQAVRICGRSVFSQSILPIPGDKVKAIRNAPIILLGYGSRRDKSRLWDSPAVAATLTAIDSTNSFLESDLTVEVADVQQKMVGDSGEVWIRITPL
jgi:hypothetical protein